MGGERFERRVNEPAALGTVIDPSRRVEQTIALPPFILEHQRLQTSVDTAVSSLDRLREHGERISPLFGSSAVSYYERLGRGHKAPGIVMRNRSDAQKHSQMEMNQALSLLRRQNHAVGRLKVSRAEASVDPRLSLENESLGRDIARNWLTPSYLGTTIAARFSRTPPILTTDPPAFSQIHVALAGREGMKFRGVYYPNTNHIGISSDIPTRQDSASTICHEYLHYVSWLGGGENIRWRDQNNQPVVAGDISWIHEGLTELHAQQLTRAHGFVRDGVSYPLEVMVCFHIQHIVGEDVLRTAYLNGDFTHVRRSLDTTLGAGTFDTLMGITPLPTGDRITNRTEAFVFFLKKLRASGIDINVRSWEDNPLYLSIAESMRRVRASGRI